MKHSPTNADTRAMLACVPVHMLTPGHEAYVSMAVLDACAGHMTHEQSKWDSDAEWRTYTTVYAYLTTYTAE